MAYESQTYEVILARMLSRVREKYPNLDTREGSMMFDALAPAALELAVMYVELDNVMRESFVNTASREYILIACEQMGMDVSVFDASAGIHKGYFDVEVPVSSRWNCDLYNFMITEYIGVEDGYYAYRMACETEGTAPNNQTGELTPITEVSSDVTYSQLVECLIEGENETSDEDVRQAYFDYVNSMATDGNVDQYYRWCSQYDGIGNAKVISLWNGANTVKVSILNASNRKASNELVEEFQNYLDHCIDKFVGDGTRTKFTLKYYTTGVTSVKINDVEQGGGYTYSNGVVTFETAPSDAAKITIQYEGGMGNGEAPIGAFVTVTTATEVPISVSAKVKLKEGFTDTSPIDEALTAYFSEIAYKKSAVSYMSLGAAILNAEGVDFISDLLVSGGTQDIKLGEEEIGVLGTPTWTVVQ